MGTLHDQIVRWFRDSPVPDALFSIQRVCHIANVAFGKKIGSWMEPSVMARVFQVGIEIP